MREQKVKKAKIAESETNDDEKMSNGNDEKDFTGILLSLEHEDSDKKLQALIHAMKLLADEGKQFLVTKSPFENSAPWKKLKAILMKILSNKDNNTNLIDQYSEYLEFNDILFFTWKILPFITVKRNPNEIYITNYLNLIAKLQIYPNSEIKNLCESESDDPFYTFDESVTKRCLNKIWNCIMHWEHTKETHRQMLIVLLEKVLIHLEKPIGLMDFLMDSLDLGGPVSLLALQGIFTMIQMHNLNYPNIFDKLYSMLKPDIFQTKYKARLFHLLDLFLSSTHLPLNLVAAFIKRLGRLALLAPSEDIIVICNFIRNLMIRYPGLKVLLHNPRGEIATDPYLMEATDPLKSNAIDSSLWELQTLQSHVQPGVAKAAKFIDSPLPTVEMDIGNILDNTSDDIFEKEINRCSKNMILQHERPIGYSLPNGDVTSKYWDFS